VENPDRPNADETFAQALAALKDKHGVTEPNIAKRIGVHVSTVNNWANGKATPRRPLMDALVTQFPDFKERLLASVGRKAPGPVSPDIEAELIKDFRELTAEQQRTTRIQVKALRESNQP